MKKIVNISRWVCAGSFVFWILLPFVLAGGFICDSIRYFLADMIGYAFLLFVFSGFIYLFGRGYRKKSESCGTPPLPEERSARGVVLIIVSALAATGMFFSGLMFLFSPIIPVPDGGEEASIFRGMVASFALAVFLVSFIARSICRRSLAKQKRSPESAPACQ